MIFLSFKTDFFFEIDNTCFHAWVNIIYLMVLSLFSFHYFQIVALLQILPAYSFSNALL